MISAWWLLLLGPFAALGGYVVIDGWRDARAWNKAAHARNAWLQAHAGHGEDCAECEGRVFP